MEKEIQETAIEEPNPCAVIGNEPAFRDGEGRDMGLTKLEYFAGQALVGILAADKDFALSDPDVADAALAKAKSLVELYHRREESE
jgi:hypothetical protein